MALHVIFLFLYIALGNTLSGEAINIILAIQCVLAFIFDIDTLKKNRFATPLNVYYICVVLICVSNVNLIGNVGSLDKTAYSYIVKAHIDIASLIWSVGCTMVFIGYKLAAK